MEATTTFFRARLATTDTAFALEVPTSALDPGSAAVVEGTLDGFPFRSELCLRDGKCWITVSHALAQAVKAQPGEELAVEVTRVGEEAEVRTPADWRNALDAAPKALSLYEQVTPMARREWVRWVISAKQDATRAKRIEVGIDKLSKGMKRPCCFPGINFVTKGLVPPEETWVALPGGKSDGEELGAATDGKKCATT